MKKHYYAEMPSNTSRISLKVQLLMISKTLLFLVTVTFTLTTYCCTAGIEAAPVVVLPPGIAFPALIAFGDSLVDPGNNNNRLTVNKANNLPYGKDFMGGNKPTGRFNNGRILSDLLADVFGIKEYVPAYLDPNLKPEELLTGVSFASGAAGYDPLTSVVTLAIPLTRQLHLFKGYVERLKLMVGDNHTSFIISNGLYIIAASSTDLTLTYFDTSIRRTHYDYNSYTDLLLNTACYFIQKLYGLGARRFVVVGAEPIGCYPVQRTVAGGLDRHCVAKENQLAHLFNLKLAKEIKILKRKLPGSRPVYLDIYDIMISIIDNPSKYGFEVVDRGCCGTGLIEEVELCNSFVPICPDHTKYLFWDSVHPTETGYQIIVNSFVGKMLQEFYD